jgi:hypothetical protein
LSDPGRSKINKTKNVAVLSRISPQHGLQQVFILSEKVKTSAIVGKRPILVMALHFNIIFDDHLASAEVKELKD